MATLHLMVGLPCSGKTTLAKRLEKECGALLLSPDAWQAALFGSRYADGPFPPETLDRMHDRIESMLWKVAARALSLGVDVILDFGFWSRAERDDYRQKARALGAGCRLHVLDPPREELFRRLAARNRAPGDDSLVIPPACLEKWLEIYEPPGKDETGRSPGTSKRELSQNA